jgi:hypothetical protein
MVQVEPRGSFSVSGIRQKVVGEKRALPCVSREIDDRIEVTLGPGKRNVEEEVSTIPL